METPNPRRPKLLDKVTSELRVRHYSPRTIEAYTGWIRRYLRHNGLRHPRTLGAEQVAAFLGYLAEEKNVAASTQNQALAALLFLYNRVLNQPLEEVRPFVRAKRPRSLPLVLSPREVSRLLGELTGQTRLMAELLYGAGLRLQECCRLRVKDLRFERGEVMIRQGKGRKDRVAPLPRKLEPKLRQHLDCCQRQHESDLHLGAGWVELPGALVRKYPNAGREWPWQWTFPATRHYRHDATGQLRRHYDMERQERVLCPAPELYSKALRVLHPMLNRQAMPCESPAPFARARLACPPPERA